MYDNQTLVSMDISGEQQLKVENDEGEDLATQSALEDNDEEKQFASITNDASISPTKGDYSSPDGKREDVDMLDS